MRVLPATSRRKQDQGGFILLVVFLMAGMVALMLYTQLPRVAFESERDKEQLLQERGQQYVRAIELYLKDNGSNWPQSIDDLERGKRRYLRRRYVDPYTGKDDWRLIHTNGGQLTDSLVQKPPTEGQSSSQSASNSQQNQEPQVNAAVYARPSDVTLPGAQSFNAPTAPTNQINNPQTFVGPTVPGQTGQTPAGAAGFGVPGMGLPPGVPLPGNLQTSAGPGQQTAQPGGFQPQFPGQQFPGQQPPPGVQLNNPQQGINQGFQPQFPGQQFPGQQPPPGVQVNNPNPQGFQPQFPGQQFPGQQPPPGVQVGAAGSQQAPPPGFQFGPNGQLVPAPPGAATPIPGQQAPSTPGLPGGTPANAGIDAIQRLLTTPRTPPAGVNVQNNAVGGGGIAGVASKHTGPSIKVYKERQKYEEWEFVYTPPAGRGGVGGIGGGQPGQPGQPGRPGQPGQPGPPGQPGQPGKQGPANPSSFGTPSGFSPSSFGGGGQAKGR